MHEVVVEGERLLLSPHRALYLPAHSTLVVADLHWGKAASFRATGVPIPSGTTDDDLFRLSHALDETGAQRLIIVGDLIHARNGRAERTFDLISTWRSSHTQLEIVLVRGNHDTHAGDPPDTWRIDCINSPLLLGPLAFQHHPGSHESHYIVAGHLHPHVHLRGRGRQGMRLPCFVFGPDAAVLPAFTTFTGGGAYVARDNDRVFVIAGNDVIPAQ